MTNSESQIQTEEGRYLVFIVGGDRYAIPLLQVREVLGNLSFTPLPQAPAYFQGIVNLRGQIITVIDLRKRLRPGKEPPKTPEMATIILDLAGNSLGVTVDAADCVREYTSEHLAPSPAVGTLNNGRFVRGVAKEDDGMVLILDIEKILNDGDRATIQSQKPAA